MIRITRRQLRRLIREVLDEDQLFPNPAKNKKLQQYPQGVRRAQTDSLIKNIWKNLKEIKENLNTLYQAQTDKDAAEDVIKVANAVGGIIKMLNAMPKLTGDPWANARD